MTDARRRRSRSCCAPSSARRPGSTLCARSRTCCASASATRWPRTCSPSPAGRRADRQVGEHQRPLRLLPARRRDGRLPAHQPARAGVRLGPAVRAALLHGPRARGGGDGGRRRRRQRVALVAVDAQVPGLGGQPEGLPVAGELDRAGAEEGPLAVLQGPGERAAAERDQPGHRRDRVRATTSRSWTASRSSRSPASTRRTTATTRIVHVFGRTPGAEPHLYYYRRFDYRQWTPWEKVDLDIQGDYLIPAVDRTSGCSCSGRCSPRCRTRRGNSTRVHCRRRQPATASTFTAGQDSQGLQLQMAVSEYRQGKWTPKRVSKDFDESALVRRRRSCSKYYSFFADRPQRDRRALRHQVPRATASAATAPSRPSCLGAFEIAGCKGVPRADRHPRHYIQVPAPDWPEPAVDRQDYPSS